MSPSEPSAGPPATAETADDTPVTRWLDGARDGVEEDFTELWEHYFSGLTQFADGRTRSAPPGAVDGEDVAASVLASLHRAFGEQRLQDVRDRDELRAVLMRMTRHKIADRVRRETALKRGGNGRDASLDQTAEDGRRLRDRLRGGPNSEDVAVFRDLFGTLLERLPDERARQIVVLSLQGHAQADVAERVDCAVATVTRKMRLARVVWNDLNDESAPAATPD